MYFRIKIFLASVLLFTSIIPALSFQQDNSLEWFESFFTDKKSRAVDETFILARRALNVALDEADLRKEARCRKTLGLHHLTLASDYDSAMHFFIGALSIEDSLHSYTDKVFTYLAIAKVFEAVGDIARSSHALEEAMRYNEKENNKKVLVYILNQEGKINAAQGELLEAFDNYKLVLQLTNQLNQPGAEADAYFNIGHLHTLQGKYSEALASHKEALAIRRKLKDRHREAQSLNDIGALYTLMKNTERAYANHTAALEIRQSLKNKRGIAESYNNLGVHFYDQQQLDRAIDNLELGLSAAREAQAQQLIKQSYEYLSLCWREKADFQKALHYKDQHALISDFIQRELNERYVLESQNRYVLDQKQTQINNLENERKRKEDQLRAQKKIRNFLFLAVSLSLIVAGLIVYSYLEKKRANRSLEAANARVNKQNVELQELNATKDKFFSIISHDLKGPLNSLTSFSNLLINYYDSLSKEEVQMLAKDFDKSLKNLFSLLENLLEWSRSQTGNIEFTPERFDLGKVLDENHALLMAQAQNKNIQLINTNDASIVVNAHRHSVTTVIRNLISNAIKFTPASGTVSFNVKKQGNEVIVSIIDTGVGMSKEIVDTLFRIDTKHSTRGTADEKGTGLGLILCKEFIEKNGGRIWVESELGKGSVFSFSLPYVPVQHMEMHPA